MLIVNMILLLNSYVKSIYLIEYKRTLDFALFVIHSRFSVGTRYLCEPTEKREWTTNNAK